MDFAFTPEQEELRAQARAFLAANPEPSWQELAELGWTGRLGRRGERRRRARLPRGGDPVRGDGPRADPRAVLVDRRRHAPGAARPTCRRRSRAARRAGRSRPARSSPISTPRPGSRTSAATRSGSSTEPSARCCRRTTRRGRSASSRAARQGGSSRAPSSCRSSAPARSTALALEACGVGARALELAVGYAKRAAAVRQADRHLPGDLASARDDADGARARPLARALRRLVHRRGRRRAAPIAAASAKSLCADAAVAACERSIQVHGGIGFTWEHVLHRLYKRALWIQSWEASGAQLRSEVAAHLLDGDEGG